MTDREVRLPAVFTCFIGSGLVLSNWLRTASNLSFFTTILFIDNTVASTL